jgi:hypothetical protein
MQTLRKLPRARPKRHEKTIPTAIARILPLSEFDAVGIQKSPAGRIKAPKGRFMKSAKADFMWGLTKAPNEWKMDLP